MARMVLVHGAFAGAWCWEPVADRLRQAGHTAETIDLPGSGADETPVAEITLDAYALRVSEVLAGGPPAVLVGHSMGGMVVTQAASRSAEHVSALVYVSAFVPEGGESLLDLTKRPEAAGDQIQANMIVEGEPPLGRLSDDAARNAIYNCSSDEQAAWALPQRRPQPLIPLTNPFTPDQARATAFAALPRSYVMCLRDNCIMPAMQRWMLGRAGCEPVIELDTDHSPYLSRTVELVDALDRLAQRSEPVAH